MWKKMKHASWVDSNNWFSSWCFLTLKIFWVLAFCHRYLLKSPVELGLAGLRKVGCPTMETYQNPRSRIICLGRCWKCSWAQGPMKWKWIIICNESYLTCDFMQKHMSCHGVAGILFKAGTVAMHDHAWPRDLVWLCSKMYSAGSQRPNDSGFASWHLRDLRED